MLDLGTALPAAGRKLTLNIPSLTLTLTLTPVDTDHIQSMWLQLTDLSLFHVPNMHHNL